MSEIPNNSMATNNRTIPITHQLGHNPGTVHDCDPIPRQFLEQIVIPDQTRPASHPKVVAYLQRLQLQGTTVTGYQHLTELLYALPDIVRINKSSIILSPNAPDPDFLDILRETCRYQVELCRNGLSVAIEPQYFYHSHPTTVCRDCPIWCGCSVHETAHNIRIELQSSAKNNTVCYDGQSYQLSAQTIDTRRHICLTRCVDAIECLLGEIRSTILDVLYHNDTRHHIAPAPRLVSVCYSELRFDGLVLPQGSPKQPLSSCLHADSGIATVLNGVKNIYSRGDAGGRRSYRQKRKRGQAVANDSFRITIGFAARREKNSLVVKFFYDLSQEPYFLVHNSHNARRIMSDVEVAQYRGAFARACAETLQIYFNHLHETSMLNGIQPDYCQDWPSELIYADRLALS